MGRVGYGHDGRRACPRYFYFSLQRIIVPLIPVLHTRESVEGWENNTKR